MTHAVINADRLLKAVMEAKHHYPEERTRSTVPMARLRLLEDLARFVAEDGQYHPPRVINISAEDFALIAEPLRYVDTKGTTK